MSEFPKQLILPDPLIHITTISAASLMGMILSNGMGALTNPSANLATFIPFRVTKPIIITTGFWLNWTTISGNFDIGIYSADGTRLVSLGSTVQSGASALQSGSLTQTELSPGLYYMAIAQNGTTGSYNGFGITAAAGKIAGLAQMASAFPLPATATFATFTGGAIPFVGFTGRSFI